MTAIHPTYDPNKGLWCFERLKAPTLRELQKKLPPRTKIIGYYPEGFPTPRYEGEPVRSVRPIFLHTKQPTTKPPTPVKNVPVPQVALVAPAPDPTIPKEEGLLNDWQAGWSAEALSEKYGINSRNVFKWLEKARNAGDPRALKHGTKCKRRKVRLGYE